jgi:hypothetical protein
VADRLLVEISGGLITMSSRYPDCITKSMVHRDIGDAEYHLNGVGRAIVWVRIAATSLRQLEKRDALDPDVDELADYHAYAGVSAARTAVDAMASWLNVWSGLKRNPSGAIDLARPDFRKKVDPLIPAEMLPHLARLNDLAVNEIDSHRQRAQHREGLAVIRYLGRGWHLAPRGAQFPRSEDLPLADLLDRWANELEAAVCDILASAMAV